MRVHIKDMMGQFRVRKIDWKNFKIGIFKNEMLIWKSFSNIEKLSPEIGDTEYNKLYSIVFPTVIPQKNYKTILIPKKNGGIRTVFQLKNPEHLKEQRMFLKENRISLSTKKCISKHLGYKYILKIDIKNAFGSVNKNRFGYLPKCLTYSFDENGMLLQGTPCASYLFEKYMQKLDTHLSSIGNYTRYVDDITFSSNDLIELETIKNQAISYINTFELTVNNSKTKILAYNKAGFKVHGVNISQNKMGIRKQKEYAFLCLKKGETNKGFGILRYIKQFVDEDTYKGFLKKASRYTAK